MRVRKFESPILVGGVGGSGTRVVTEILMKIGFFMGGNLNRSNDYMGYGLAKTLRELMSNETVNTDDQLIHRIHHRLDKIELDIKNDMQDSHLYQGWGWKVPGNFYLLEHANRHFVDVKYIHVIRHGLDMAFSSNQNQLNNWGWYFDIDINALPLPVASLRYWIEANKFAYKLGANLLDKRFYVLSFDELVTQPNRVIEALSVFLGAECSDIDDLASIVHRPDSLGRFKQEDISVFSDNDIKEVADFGFQV